MADNWCSLTSFIGHLVDGRPPIEWTQIGIPLLVVEVLSPSTADYDHETKRRLFQRVGVPDYWIIDADARQVECWRPGDRRPRICHDRLVWRPDESVPALEIDLAAYFRRVWGEGRET